MIIIPTYNEKGNVSALVSAIRKYLPRERVLFVDDNSPDGTQDEIRKLSATDPNILLYPRPYKKGFASAYTEAMSFALGKYDDDHFIIMDGDQSHPAEKLPEMLKALADYDFVIGSRYARGGNVENWNFKRRMLSRMANYYLRLMVGLRIKDTTAGFMVFRRALLEQIKWGDIRSSGYFFLVELKLQASSLGAKFMEVPITFTERKAGQSKLSSKIFYESLLSPVRYVIRKYGWQYWAGFFSVILLPMAVYLMTLPSSIFLGDSSEFIALVKTLGIGHPPGYPSYILAAKLFSFLPLGSIEYEVALFSAVCASAALAWLYSFMHYVLPKETRGLGLNAAISAGTVMLLGFSPIFWSQAVMAKMYVPFLLSLAIILWLWMKFAATKENKYFYWTAFLFGFGFGLHQTIIFYLPLILLLIWADSGLSLRQALGRAFTKPAFISVGLGILGLLTYAYLPIRSAMSPLYDWTHIGYDFTKFLNYVMRKDYDDFGIVFSWEDKLSLLNAAGHYAWNQFGWFLLLSLPGMLWLLKERKKVFMALTGLIIFNIASVLVFRKIGWSLEYEEYQSFYYLPAYAGIALLIGFGVYAIFRNFKERYLSAALALAFALVCGLFIRNGWEANNIRHFTFLDDYSYQVMSSMPANSALIVSDEGMVHDSEAFSLLYQQRVQGVGQGIKIIFLDDDITRLREIRKEYIETQVLDFVRRGNAVYTSFIVDDLDPSWRSESNGYVYRFLLDERPKAGILNSPVLKDSDRRILQHSLFGKDLLAQYYYAQAAWHVQNGGEEAAKDLIMASINNDDQPAGEDFKGYLKLRANAGK